MVVLRCEPMVLKRRLSQRGYSFEKTIQNVEAELIGVIASDATSAFGKGKTMEFDTSASSAAESAKAIARMVQEQKPTGTRIDWMPSYGSARKLRALLDPEVLVRD
jgi:adenylate kinase